MTFDPEVMTEQQLANMENDLDLGVVDLPPLSSQVRYYVAARVGGMVPSAASVAAGAAASTGSRWERSPDVQMHIQHYEKEFSEKVMPRIEFTMEKAHRMYMESYHSAGTSAEMTRATDSLVKLHGLLDQPEEQKALPTSARQLEGLSSQQLLRYASIGMDTLRPGEVYDAETGDADDGE